MRVVNCTYVIIASPLLCCGKFSVQCQPPPFLGAFAKLRKATVTFVMSACPFVRPHETVMHGQREI